MLYSRKERRGEEERGELSQHGEVMIGTVSNSHNLSTLQYRQLTVHDSLISGHMIRMEASL
jgi:hypothetical protein